MCRNGNYFIRQLYILKTLENKFWRGIIYNSRSALRPHCETGSSQKYRVTSELLSAVSKDSGT